jgi:hypothetical protein
MELNILQKPLACQELLTNPSGVFYLLGNMRRCLLKTYRLYQACRGAALSLGVTILCAQVFLRRKF